MLILQQSRALIFTLIYCVSQFSAAESQLNLSKNVSSTIQHIINKHSHPYITQSHFLAYQHALDELYFLSSENLLWLKKNNINQLSEVLKLISHAKENGLNPADYNLDWLSSVLQHINDTNQYTIEKLSLIDTAISINLLHFLSDLHYGRINPRNVGFNFNNKRKPANFVPLILSAHQENQIPSLLDKAEPKIAVYHTLKKALSDYRNMDTSVNSVPLKYRSSIKPKKHSYQVALIRRQLIHLNILDDIPGPLNNLYDSNLVKTIKTFQFHHGLTEDGVIGKKTIQALNISLSNRIEQIELSLERLRWLPKTQSKSLIFVNIPAFQLWAYDSNTSPQSQPLNMKVIVGKSKELKSPVFSSKMYYLEFSPYWNIPKSITLEEILPKLRENPLYLDQQRMELVTGFHNNELAIPYTEDTIELLISGSLKLRQRPGGGNALGRVKFIFPNNYNVYLHDTPSRHLFRKDKRDLSHGCIRVEKPTELAKFLLKSKPWWNKKKIFKTMRAKRPERVKLKTPIPVIIYYSTAFAINQKVFFYNDVYRYDSRLKQALATQSKKQFSLISAKESISYQDLTLPVSR